MQTLPLINNFPTRTPMEDNQSNLEVSITMMMITGQIAQEAKPDLTDALVIASAALHNPAEA